MKKELPPFEYPIDPTQYCICGVDEAGRGPLMGNVVAACVILDRNNPIEGLNDSKKLSEKKRDLLEPVIKEKALAYGIGICTPEEIDTLNILNASLEAMKRAYINMNHACHLMLVDGNKTPKDLPIKMEAVVKGDARVAEIAAALIPDRALDRHRIERINKPSIHGSGAEHVDCARIVRLAAFGVIPDILRERFSNASLELEGNLYILLGPPGNLKRL